MGPPQHHQHHEDIIPEQAMSLRESLSASLRSNRSAIECLRTNDIGRALEYFSMAFATHERAQSKLLASMGMDRTGRNRRGGSNNNLSGTTDIGKDMGEWFVRDLSPRLWGNGEEKDDDAEDSAMADNLLCCEPIRLPLAMETAVEATTHSGDPGVENSTPDVMNLLASCHAYNLGLIHHLCGIQSLRWANDAASGASNRHGTNASDTSEAMIHFGHAERMYEFTLRMERVRSANLKQQQEQQEHRIDHRGRPTETNVPRLIIVLACLNNLSDLYHKSNQVVRCLHFYRHLKKTTQQLLSLLLPGQQHPDEDLLRAYLPAFWNRSQKGLSRLRRRSNSSTNNDASGEPTNNEASALTRTASPPPPIQSHYAFNSSAAGAA